MNKPEPATARNPALPRQTGDTSRHYFMHNPSISAMFTWMVLGLLIGLNPLWAGSAAAQGFECVESVAGYKNLSAGGGVRNPLYTKLAGTAFSVEVVAIDSAGNVLSGYTANNVSVELFNGSTPAAPSCPATITPVASTTVNFIAGDNGKKTVTLTVNSAAPSLRCKVTDNSAAPAVSACSSDHFSVRPHAFSSITSSQATADSNGLSVSNAPALKASLGTFDLIANTGVAGYNGTPKINPGRIEWPLGPLSSATPVGALSGNFSVAANAGSGNNAQGNNFTYGEVGYFRFQTNGVLDDTFVSSSGDVANGDCTNDFANSISGNGQYGCLFGNTAVSNYFGRFIPDHFTLASSALTPVCSNASNASNSFSYMSQTGLTPLVSASIQAQNASGVVTVNYTGDFAKASVSPQLENANNGTPILARLHSPSGAWNAGVFSFASTAFDRQSNGLPDGPYDLLDIGVALSDESNTVQLLGLDMNAADTSCTLANPATCDAKKISTTSVRYGRLALTNAFGSEVLPLPVALRLEYWAGANLGWQRNNNDICTSFTANQFAVSFPAGTAAKPNNLAACETTISLAGTAPNQTVRLSAPGVGNAGWADLTLNLAATANGNACVAAAPSAATTANQPALQFNWLGTGNQNPRARATFGVYKNPDQFIYLRELH